MVHVTVLLETCLKKASLLVHTCDWTPSETTECFFLHLAAVMSRRTPTLTTPTDSRWLSGAYACVHLQFHVHSSTTGRLHAHTALAAAADQERGRSEGIGQERRSPHLVPSFNLHLICLSRKPGDRCSSPLQVFLCTCMMEIYFSVCLIHSCYKLRVDSLTDGTKSSHS